MYIDEKCKWTPYGTNSEMDDLVRSDWVGRQKAAYKGYGLDELVYDSDYDVRRMVAQKGYGLDKLITDNKVAVRVTVAQQGYGLDKLIKDSHADVRSSVERYLNDNHMDINKWRRLNPDKCYYNNNDWEKICKD